MCIGATLAFLSSLQTSGSDSIFLLIPLGTQIGIIFALGICECASIAWRGTQGVLLSLLDELRALVGADDTRLPRYEDPRPITNSASRPDRP